MAIRGPLHPPEGGGSDPGGGITSGEAQTLIDDSIADHEAAVNPHPGYLTPAEGDAAYQPLDEVPVFAFFA